MTDVGGTGGVQPPAPLSNEDPTKQERPQANLQRQQLPQSSLAAPLQVPVGRWAPTGCGISSKPRPARLDQCFRLSCLVTVSLVLRPPLPDFYFPSSSHTHCGCSTPCSHSAFSGPTDDGRWLFRCTIQLVS